MIGQMAIAIGLIGFNDLGRSLTPTFLFRNRFYFYRHIVQKLRGGPFSGALCTLRRNPAEFRVTSRKQPLTKIVYIVLDTSVRLF